MEFFTLCKYSAKKRRSPFKQLRIKADSNCRRKVRKAFITAIDGSAKSIIPYPFVFGVVMKNGTPTTTYWQPSLYDNNNYYDNSDIYKANRATGEDVA